MNGSEIRLAVFAKTQDRFRRDYGGRTASGQTYTFTPAGAVSVARTGHIRNAFGQALFAVFHKNHESMCERGDVARASGSGQTSVAFRSAHLGGVQIAEAVNFCGSEKSQIDAAGLQQTHNAEHVQALRCA